MNVNAISAMNYNTYNNQPATIKKPTTMSAQDFGGLNKSAACKTMKALTLAASLVAASITGQACSHSNSVGSAAEATVVSQNNLQKNICNMLKFLEVLSSDTANGTSEAGQYQPVSGDFVGADINMVYKGKSYKADLALNKEISNENLMSYDFKLNNDDKDIDVKDLVRISNVKKGINISLNIPEDFNDPNSSRIILPITDVTKSGDSLKFGLNSPETIATLRNYLVTSGAFADNLEGLDSFDTFAPILANTAFALTPQGAKAYELGVKIATGGGMFMEFPFNFGLDYDEANTKTKISYSVADDVINTFFDEESGDEPISAAGEFNAPFVIKGKFAK